MSREQIPILVARDRSGTTTDYLLADSRKGAIMAALKPLLPADAVVCTDGGGSIGQAVKDLGLEHHPVVTSKGRHAIGAWHIQNVNSYHGRFKGWMRRFRGVATSYLENYLGWFRASTARHVPPHNPRSCSTWLSAPSAIIFGLSELQSPGPLKAFLSSIP